ncbi:hypothetical protein [Terrisporobacter sp.]
MINSVKPFYVYEENNCLFIKNINEKIDKIANNIVSYCANFDDNNFIHICSIDTNGRLIHFMYKNGKIRRRNLCKVCHNIFNLKNMRLFIIQNYLNIFLVEESSIDENCYRVSHFNFTFSNYNIQKHYFNNTVKTDDFIYKLNIDDMNNMIFTYNSISNNKNSKIDTHTLIFNNSNRKWITTRSSLRSTCTFEKFNSFSTIKDDIFEYCYSIVYKDF